MYTSPDYFRTEVPTGVSGRWAIERVVIPERAYDPAVDQRPDCFKFRAGTYTSLRCGDVQFMTDLYDEWWTQRAAIAEARERGGEVLVTGLGLGVVVEAMLRAPSAVSRVTVVELSADVIALVGPYLTGRYGERVEIVQGDAFAWRPPAGRHFTVGWHDVWPDPHAAVCQPDMERLERHYRDHCDWQGFWPREYQRAAACA